jgi:hypothetical protein
MQRLLAVSILSVATAASTGCFHCFQRQQAARPCVPAPPPCCPAPVDPCATPGMVTTPGVMTTAPPSLTVPPGGAPVQVMPGPEAYSTP